MGLTDLLKEMEETPKTNKNHPSFGFNKEQ
jgi:hypothetical protein